MSPPQLLVFMVTDYVRAQAEPVALRDIALALTQGRTDVAASALASARGRGYVQRVSDSDKRWCPGPIEPHSAEDQRTRAQRRWEAHHR